MFTGIIEGTGKVKKIEKNQEGVRLEVEVHFNLDDLNVGDSIAINGVCLTVTSRLGHTFWADLATETLKITNLSQLQVGSSVNVERPLRVGDRLGGHFVQGHVDAVSPVLDIQDLGNTKEITIEIPSNIFRYIVDKGSVTVDGVSLTVARSTETSFTVCVIPHTQLQTTFHALKVGDRVNLEVDILGKYVEKLGFMESEAFHNAPQIKERFLKKHGF
ncbi:MAG: riboflavin synthase [Deltaproteobacteria bacterium CG11_big_fil_rev_8_21_14_0_20_47_16]|nr:MAG: riboflavin synthase [Deltaproteobacteria bacterium CG11_big_fil_rev_8_21_14_0_20_47_16]